MNVIDETVLTAEDNGYDEDHTGRTIYVRLEVEGHPSPDEVKEWIDENMPEVRCQHDFDCCAQWYPSRGYVEAQARRGNDMVLFIRQRQILNV